MSKSCLSMAAQSSRNAIGPPRGRATIEVGIAVVGATLMPDEEPDIAVAAVTIPVVIVTVSLPVTPSVTVGVLIVVLSLSMSSESPVAVVIDVSALRRCRATVALTIPPCPPSPSLVPVACRCHRGCRRVRSSPSCPPLLPLLVAMPLKSRHSDCTKKNERMRRWREANNVKEKPDHQNLG